jgi:hypothetical protein
MKTLGNICRVAAVVVAILFLLPMLANEIITTVDPATGRHSDLLGRGVTSEGRNHRTLEGGILARIPDAIYSVIGLGAAFGLFTLASRLDPPARSTSADFHP